MRFKFSNTRLRVNATLVFILHFQSLLCKVLWVCPTIYIMVQDLFRKMLLLQPEDVNFFSRYWFLFSTVWVFSFQPTSNSLPRLDFDSSHALHRFRIVLIDLFAQRASLACHARCCCTCRFRCASCWNRSLCSDLSNAHQYAISLIWLSPIF